MILVSVILDFCSSSNLFDRRLAASVE